LIAILSFFRRIVTIKKRLSLYLRELLLESPIFDSYKEQIFLFNVRKLRNIKYKIPLSLRAIKGLIKILYIEENDLDKIIN